MAGVGGPEPIEVAANEKQVHVGKAQNGETWLFRASGRWRDAWIPCGPQGYRNFAADVLGIRPRVRQLPWFSLVGRFVRDTDQGVEEFCIGQEADYTFHDSGEVVVFANDLEDRYDNNFGSVKLRVDRLQPEPGGPEAMAQRGGSGATAVIGDVVASAREAWDQALSVLDRTAGVPFVFLLILLAGFALAFLQQGEDLIRTIGEDPLGAASSQQIAFAITLIFLGVQAWFWPRMVVESNYGADPETWKPRWLLEGTPRLLGFLPFVFTFFALLRAPSHDTPTLVILVVLGFALLAFLIFRRRIFRGKDTGIWLKLGPAWAVFGLVLAPLSVAAAVVWPVRLPVNLGGPAVVFLAFGLFIPPVIILIQLSRGFRLPLFGCLLVLAVVASFWLDDHRVGARLLGIGELHAAPHRQSLQAAYTQWRAQAPALADGTRPMVLIASEGGASRAGFWTGEVLSALSARFPGIDKRVFAISSVSGGSVGSVGYVAALKEAPNATGAELENRVSGFTGADALSPALGGMLFPDLLQRFIPFAFLPDRAQSLERAWEIAWKDRATPKGRPGLISERFQALWDDVASTGWRPLVIVNGAGEEEGRPILTSRIEFDHGLLDADDFYAINKTDIPASTAIHNGARFPAISPAGRMPRGHIVDGGYFEGSGLETIRQLALAIQQGPGKTDRLRFVVIFIGYLGPHPQPMKTFLNDLDAPLIAIFNARAAAGPHMVTALVKDFDPSRTADAYAVAPNRDGAVLPGVYAPILLFDAPAQNGEGKLVPPLNWALSKRIQTYMRKSAGFCPPSEAGHLAVFREGRLSTHNRAAFAAVAAQLAGASSRAPIAPREFCPGETH